MTTTTSKSDGKGLAKGQLGLFGSTVMGLASTAPVYSLAATLGYVVLAVGPQAPIAFILAFIPMFFIAFAYRELNRAVPDCGTTFTWARRRSDRGSDGWAAGASPSPASSCSRTSPRSRGKYFWLLVGQDELANTTWVVTAHGRRLHRADGLRQLPRHPDRRAPAERAARHPVPRSAALRGLRRSLRSPTARPRATPRSRRPGSTRSRSTSFDGFTEAILLALFIYWGWDTCLALNEETKDPKRIPGQAALLSTVILRRHLRRGHGRRDGLRGPRRGRASDSPTTTTRTTCSTP